MLCTATQALYILLETSQRGQPSKGGRVLPFALTAFLCLVSGIYIIWQDPVFHQVAYAAILLSAVGRVTYLLHHRLRQTPFEFQRNLLVKGLCRLGVFFFALAFIIWNLDNLLCNRLQPYKDAWGLPLAYLLEGQSALSRHCLLGLTRIKRPLASLYRHRGHPAGLRLPHPRFVLEGRCGGVSNALVLWHPLDRTDAGQGSLTPACERVALDDLRCSHPIINCIAHGRRSVHGIFGETLPARRRASELSSLSQAPRSVATCAPRANPPGEYS
jgi:hypothetical protein